jgi:ferredoxin--NADP+ reductase
MEVLEIISNKQITPEAYILEIPRTFNFQPGQVINIYIDGFAPRMYSIASGINDNSLRILYDIKPDGEITPRLKEYKKGDRIKISGPLGKFSCDDNPGYWIANGTGIAPFYSMFRSGLATGKVLIQGARTRDSFYFQDEFLQYFQNGNYIRCSSVEKDDAFYNSRLTLYLKEQNNLPVNQKYYLCGSTEMVVETRDILIFKGIPFGNIMAEIYF